MGNNNAYCHDSPLTWLDWDLLQANAPLFRFVQRMVAFRRAHPVLRSRTHFRNCDYVGSGYPDISWHGVRAWQADWSAASRTIAFLLCGRHARGGLEVDDYIYAAFNMHWECLSFEVPLLPPGLRWHVFANTAAEPPADAWEPGHEPEVENPGSFLMGGRSVAILVGR
jgi:isoamylase